MLGKLASGSEPPSSWMDMDPVLPGSSIAVEAHFKVETRKGETRSLQPR